ncbi:MAG TPA: tyrosinase family protein [Thermoanaerobaculia bacterium]
MTVLAGGDLLAGNLHVRDTTADTGAEPSPPGLIYLSPDIWVRRSPDPAYLPFPFSDSGPMPWTPAPHENAEYRDPRVAVPNWVYVRVRNHGTSASTGTERLRVYWAEASTGLAWDAQWVDHLASNCGPTKLYGAEITKPRKNAAGPNTTATERNRFRDAIIAIGTNPAYRFSDASYWHKQDEVHELGPTNRHGQPAFFPWHREMINRFELLLQEHDPLVKLLYWDWTTSPLSLFTSTFMGSSGLGTTSGVSMGAPFTALGPPTVIRRLQAASPTTVIPDSSLTSSTNYHSLRTLLEGQPHNANHGYIGGVTSLGFPIGNMSDADTATEDPFFFLLHTNADRIWAAWQRSPLPANVARLDPNTAYTPNSSHASITDTMVPWNGSGKPFFPPIEPWSPNGGQTYAKTPLHPSVVSPPIYDTVPLVVPVLNPGQAVVLQIPWYPPNPADFSCGADAGHFCLLARIESGPAPLFGMSTLETSDLPANVRNNRDIAWKNITVEEFSGVFKMMSPLVRNVFPQRTFTTLRIAEAPGRGTTFREAGRVTVDLGPTLFQRWVEGGSRGRGVQPVNRRRSVRSDAAAGTLLQVTSADATLENIRLEPGEVFPLDVRLELDRAYRPTRAVPALDIVQNGTPANPNALVGGQRFELDLSRIVLIRAADDEWRVLDDGPAPGAAWLTPAFDDTKWKVRRAELGLGDEPESTIAAGTTTYFRREFEVADPSFFRSLLLRLKRDDGAVVYLNGTEVHRVNLGQGTVTAGTFAQRRVEGVEEETFFPVPLNASLLRFGRNVIAVELHQFQEGGDDATFDLELTANRADTSFAPNVEIAADPLVQVGLPLAVTVDALDSDGQVRGVTLFLDDQPVLSATSSPATFTLTGISLGTHRLRVVVTDDSNQQSAAHTTFSVLENTPPRVTLTQPQDGTRFAPGQPITVSALASDPGGAVERVEFYLQRGHTFGAPETLIGTALQPPYRITLPPLEPGHYRITAVAWDAGAEEGTDAVHLSVTGNGHGH